MYEALVKQTKLAHPPISRHSSSVSTQSRIVIPENTEIDVSRSYFLIKAKFSTQIVHFMIIPYLPISTQKKMKIPLFRPTKRVLIMEISLNQLLIVHFLVI